MPQKNLLADKLKSFSKDIILCGLAFAMFLSPMGAQSDEGTYNPDKLIMIGTASRSGSFYPIGQTLCDLINKDRAEKLIRCVSYPTAGSDYNTQAVLFGQLTLGMTRSDIAAQEFNNGKDKDNTKGANLRAIMSLYDMPVLVIAKRSLGITDLSQIPGHTLNIGNGGSGQRAIVEMILKSLKFDKSQFTNTTEFNTSQMGDAFCDGKVDIIVEALGNPSPFYKKMIEKCDGQMIGATPETIKTMLAKNPSLEALKIKGDIYAGEPNEVLTFGYKAVIVASKQTSDAAVKSIIKSIFDRLDDLKKSDVVLANLEPKKMFTEGIKIPLHTGIDTKNYYK